MVERVFYSHNRSGEYLKYLYYQKNSDEKLPLLVYLAGAGSRGDDLSMMGNVGPIKEINNGRELPCVMVAPQCHALTWFELFDVLLEFIDSCRHDSLVDDSRVYLCGTSMGAYTAWNIACNRPDWFAALVPVCGGGMCWLAEQLKNVPVWAFHGMQDDVVRPEESLQMVRAVNAMGGNAKLTLYPNTGHASWEEAYATDEMWHWMFEQQNKRGV